jgi:uncharacterized membrane protein
MTQMLAVPGRAETLDGVDATTPHPFPGRMVAATVAMLVVAYAIQLAVFGHGGHSSLSDLPRVYLHRGVGPGELPYVDRVTEYPVGSGVLLYLAALVAPSALGVFTVTAVVAGGLCVLITVVLERRYGGRAWRWALGTPLVLFAFQNWDVFAIAAALAGLLAFERHRHRLAGALLACGAAVKLFPAVLLPPFVALRWVEGDRRGARRLATWGIVVFAALNLPFVVANRAGWWWPFAFQSRRNATWGSVWFWAYRALGVPHHGATGARVADLVSAVALLVGLVCLTGWTARRRPEPAVVAAAAVTIFVLSNKVYSPTYDVWLVVFFVLLPLGRRLWIAFCAVDLAIAGTVYGYFHGSDSGAFVHAVLPWLVLFRTGLLVVLLVTVTGAAPRLARRTYFWARPPFSKPPRYASTRASVNAPR